MKYIFQPIAHLARRAAVRALAHATAAEKIDPRYRRAALEAAARAHDAAVLATFAAQGYDRAGLFGHLRAARGAVDRARDIEQQARRDVAGLTNAG